MALYPATLHGPAPLTVVDLISAPSVYAAATPVTGVSASNVTIVKQIIVCNTGAAGTFSLYLGTSAAAATNALFEGVALGAGETKIINTSLVLRGTVGQKLFARASATTVLLTLVGLEEY